MPALPWPILVASNEVEDRFRLLPSKLIVLGRAAFGVLHRHVDVEIPEGTRPLLRRLLHGATSSVIRERK